MPLPSIVEARELVRAFCQPPRFAQMITLNKAGALRGRTLGAAMRPDWTVEVASFASFARAGQLKRNANMMLIWTDGAVAQRQEGVRDDGNSVPKVVYATGQADVLEGDAFAAWYEARVAEKGPIRNMTTQEAVAAMSMIVFRVEHLRLEGFAAAGTTIDFAEVTSGLQFDPREG